MANMTTDNGRAVLLKDKITLATTALCLAALAVSGWFVFDGGSGNKNL